MDMRAYVGGSAEYSMTLIEIHLDYADTKE